MRDHDLQVEIKAQGRGKARLMQLQLEKARNLRKSTWRKGTSQ
jgi:hypothetical protein